MDQCCSLVENTTCRLCFLTGTLGKVWWNPSACKKSGKVEGAINHIVLGFFECEKDSPNKLFSQSYFHCITRQSDEVSVPFIRLLDQVQTRWGRPTRQYSTTDP